MKERHFRKPVYIEAEIIVCGKMFAGIIVNLSEDSVLVEVPVYHNEIGCPPDSVIELRFDTIVCGPVNLPCRVTRIYAEETRGGTVTRMGMKIDHVPQKYKDYLKTLD
jgi:hypothetical protein